MTASACVVRQFGTNFHRICEAQTPGNSLRVVLSASYSSVLTAGGASDRRWLKAHHTDGLTYLLTRSISSGGWKTYPVFTKVSVDSMDKADDSMRSIGEVRYWRECIQAHSMHLIALLSPPQHIHTHTASHLTRDQGFDCWPDITVQ